MNVGILASGNPLNHVVQHPILEPGGFTLLSNHIIMQLIAAALLIIFLPRFIRQRAGKDEVGRLVPRGWGNAIELYDLSGACDIVMEYVRVANRFIEENAPWKLAKDHTKKDDLVAVLCDLTSVIIGAAWLLSPYIPESSQKIWEAFGCAGKISDQVLEDTFRSVMVPAGMKIHKINALFPRIEEKKKVSDKISKSSSGDETGR